MAEIKCKIFKEICKYWKAVKSPIAKTTIQQYPLKDQYLKHMSNTQIDNEVIFCFVCLFFIMQENLIFSPWVI